MTEREIKKYIDRLNSKNYVESIFLRQVSDYVDVAKVWSEQSKISDNVVGNFESYRFFFIKNEQGEYVGAILDMYHDLHWFISVKHRKKGYLTKALRETVLPYLFYEGRDYQRITIEKGIGRENYHDSKKVAVSLNFEPVNERETEFKLEKEKFNWEYQNLDEINNKISKERIEILRKRIHFAYKILHKVSDELLMAFDDDLNLGEKAKEINYYTWKIEDI